MSVRRPVLIVNGAGGSNLVPQWGKSLLGATITDQAGYESDEAVFRFTAPPFDPPAKGTLFTVAFGWEAKPPTFGIYEVSRNAFGGDPESGETMRVHCRAADFLDKMKTSASRHYDEENGHGTAGKIFRAVAAEAGVPAIIAPAIEGIEIPYRLRMNQSGLDFATDLADEVGAIVKPQAGKLVVMQRGAGLSGSGVALPPIVIPHDPSYAWDVEIEERPAFSEAQRSWFDPKTGRLKTENASTGRTGGRNSAIHPAPTQGEAVTGAGALAQQLSRYTGTGSFEGAGQSIAMAGAPVFPAGFGSAVDGTPWEATAVTHDIEPENGWVMTVEVETKETAA